MFPNGYVLISSGLCHALTCLWPDHMCHPSAACIAPLTSPSICGQWREYCSPTPLATSDDFKSVLTNFSYVGPVPESGKILTGEVAPRSLWCNLLCAGGRVRHKRGLLFGSGLLRPVRFGAPRWHSGVQGCRSFDDCCSAARCPARHDTSCRGAGRLAATPRTCT